MDERQFEREYQNWKRQSAPDLWNRIEGRLKDYPEREQRQSGTFPCAASDTPERATNRQTKRKLSRRMLYGTAAGIAAGICLMVSVPGVYRAIALKYAKGQAAYEIFPDAGMAEETKAAVSAETKADMSDQAEGEVYAAGNEADKITEKASQTGVIPAGTVLRVPENALTVPADSAYFSQAVLADTELLCAGTVEDVFLEYDGQGRAVKVVYELSAVQLYYAQDYFTQAGQLTVKSPIVEAEGDEVYLLYQMKKEKTYLLPLKKQEGNWELIYPFAPQVEITGGQTYLFHSGYSSLIDENTQVVKGEQEGENDYFYDRMLLREDEDFLADFLQLVEEQVRGS